MLSVYGDFELVVYAGEFYEGIVGLLEEFCLVVVVIDVVGLFY